MQNAFRSTSEPAPNWAAVWSIAAGTFLLVATEFLPIGLLSKLATDFHVSDGTAGLSVTAPGLIAAVAAPALVLLARALDRRVVILCLTAAIVVSNLIAVAAGSFAVFLVGRVILGAAVGGLWAFAVAVGRRLVPQSAGGRATSVISAGISAGSIFGLPVGALAGGWVGWRPMFAVNTAIGVIVMIWQARAIPRLAAGTAVHMGKLLAFVRGPMARTGLLATALVAAGHFIAYTFVEPFLRGPLQLSQNGVALALAGYAAAGILGAFAGEKLALRDVRRAFVIVAVLTAAAVLATRVLAPSPAASLAALLVWGVAFGAFPVCVQIWMFNASPALFEAGSALMVSAFQVSLSIGAGVGGLLVDRAGLGVTFIVSGIVAALGAGMAASFRPTRAAIAASEGL